MGKPTKRATEREAEKQELIRVGQALLEKYPPEVYQALELEPEDILKHTRSVIQFCSKYRVSEREAGDLHVRFGPPPWPGHPERPTVLVASNNGLILVKRSLNDALMPLPGGFRELGETGQEQPTASPKS